MIICQFTQFPFPPSDNRKFLSRSFIKSKEWRDFELDVSGYAIRTHRTIAEAQDILKEHPHKPLRIDITLWMPHERLYTKKNSIKRIDAANFLKSLLDQIAKMLDIDDSLFFDVRAQKQVNPSEDLNFVDFCIRLF